MARDAIINLIGRAISTGMPRQANIRTKRLEPVDERFFAGRSTAFVEAAAIVAETVYGVEYMGAKHWLNLRVRDVRHTWNPALLRDGELVGKEATTILDDLLNT